MYFRHMIDFLPSHIRGDLLSSDYCTLNFLNPDAKHGPKIDAYHHNKLLQQDTRAQQALIKPLEPATTYQTKENCLNM